MTTYIITRTSFGENRPPCDEAVEHIYSSKKGNSTIRVYTIEIDSLDSLNAFTAKYGQIIVEPTATSSGVVFDLKPEDRAKVEGMPSIMIYDSWVE